MKVLDVLQAFYLDYFNNYLTVGAIAEAHGLTETQAAVLIRVGREVHEACVLTHAKEGTQS